MNASLGDLIFYAIGIFLLLITPGPVWIAIVARSVTNGVRGAWPLTAILGLSWITKESGEYLFYLKWLAAVIFFIIAIGVPWRGDTLLNKNKALSTLRVLPGFLAGVTVILSNPKALLFYMGILPGFFNLRNLTSINIGVILIISAVIPMCGNIAFAVLIKRARGLIHSAASVRKINITSGLLLIL